MKQDVLALAAGRRPSKRPSKETLNHPELIRLASGLDPFKETPQAYLAAYQTLGIDILNRVPSAPAPDPLRSGETRDLGNGHWSAYLGLYDTISRVRFPFSDVDDFLRADPESIRLDYHALITPVPHALDSRTIREKEKQAGDVGVYYYQIYTTLFMWGVEHLGWEVYMMAQALDPDRLDRVFLTPAFEQSLALMEVLSETDCPFVFCHDDLADRRGPIFDPAWYRRFIFPRYPALFQPAVGKGKKIIFVADGNMEPFFDDLLRVGIDGVMFEAPATDFDATLEAFGSGIVIGGIDTRLLSLGTPGQVRDHVLEVHEKTADYPGFVMSSCGGLHGSIPLENLIAYFDTRTETGHTPMNWRRM